MRVQNFAKDTGDYIGLSKVDQRLISLGVKIALDRGEGHLIRKEPKDLSEFRPENLKKAYDAFESSGSDEDSDDSDKD